MRKKILADCFKDSDFPIILRPVGSQGERDLEKMVCPEELSLYLSKVDAQEFYVSFFIDYRSRDRLFRKYRVALIDGVAYACHMGVSSHWMVHYANAGMYEDADKRKEDKQWMESFDEFSMRIGKRWSLFICAIGSIICVSIARKCPTNNF